MVEGDGPQRLLVAVPELVTGLTTRERDVEVTTCPSLGAADVGVDRLGIAPGLEGAGRDLVETLVHPRDESGRGSERLRRQMRAHQP
jgi:hypothetical protein